MESEQQQQEQRLINTQDLAVFKNEMTTAFGEYVTQQLRQNTEEILNRMTIMLRENNNNDNEVQNNIEFDEDHDVIMRNGITSSVTPVPDPGLFSGDTKQTTLFCELCESILNTYPYNQLTIDEQKNFITSRLRGPARIWYQIKYKENDPVDVKEIIEELKKAFSNITSIKLAKIQLIELKQSYGKIEDYIEKFRTYSGCLEINATGLSLLFLNGLHPKYKNEIKKTDVLPESLEEMITKCIMYENSLKTNNKLNIHTSNKNDNYRKRNNRKFNKNFSKNNNKNSNNNNSNNKDNIYAQKINTKN